MRTIPILSPTFGITALMFAVAAQFASADEAPRLADINALPTLRERAIEVREIEAVGDLYLLNGTRVNRRGKTVPVSLAVSRDLKYIFFGRIHDNHSGRDLYIRKPMHGYHEQASFTQGAGSEAYYIFIDTECPWCVRMEAELAKQPLPRGVRLHYYLYPLRGGDVSSAKSRYILSRPDDAARVTAMRDLMLRGDTRYQTAALGAEQPEIADAHVRRVRTIAQDLAVRGTPTIFAADGTRYTYREFLRELRRD